MKCIWCNGTSEECGCGLGYCAHCKNGETSDPPFGPHERSPELDILTADDFDKISFGNGLDAHEAIDAVSFHLVGRQVLSVEELQQLKDFWDDDYRDETIGNVLNRAAWLVKEKTK